MERPRPRFCENRNKNESKIIQKKAFRNPQIACAKIWQEIAGFSTSRSSTCMRSKFTLGGWENPLDAPLDGALSLR